MSSGGQKDARDDDDDNPDERHGDGTSVLVPIRMGVIDFIMIGCH
jgi:hypothetical protein